MGGEHASDATIPTSRDGLLEWLDGSLLALYLAVVGPDGDPEDASADGSSASPGEDDEAPAAEE